VNIKYPKMMIGVALAVGWIGFKFATSPGEPQAQQTATPADVAARIPEAVTTPEQQVVAQMIGRYRMALSGGTYGDLCVQAGMVKAAMLHAADQQGYTNWTQQERTVCRWASGVSEYSVGPDLRAKALSNAKVVHCDRKGIPIESKRCKVTDEQVEQEYQGLMTELTQYLPNTQRP
jgi:hypothetical protein